MKPTECPAKAKNEQRKAKKEGGEKAKSKSQDFCVTFKPKNFFFLKFCFLRMPQLHKLIWIRGSLSVRPVNRKLCGKF